MFTVASLALVVDLISAMEVLKECVYCFWRVWDSESSNLFIIWCIKERKAVEFGLAEADVARGFKRVVESREYLV